MNWDLWFKGFNVLAVMASAALNVYLFLRAKEDKRLEAIEERQAEVDDLAEADRETVRLAVAERRAHINDLHQRVSLVEERLRQMPTHDDLRKIYDKLTELVSQVGRQDERSANTNDAVRRIEQHLMER